MLVVVGLHWCDCIQMLRDDFAYGVLALVTKCSLR